MILKRKKDAPILETPDGAPRPDIIATVLDVQESKKNKILKIECAYFHSNEAWQAGKEPIPGARFVFSFNPVEGSNSEFDTEGNRLKVGYPTYDELMQDVKVDDFGELVFLNENAEAWFMAQHWVLDCEGKKWSENWEFAD